MRTAHDNAMRELQKADRWEKSSIRLAIFVGKIFAALTLVCCVGAYFMRG